MAGDDARADPAPPPNKIDEVDEVERLLGQWRRERPDLDASPLAVMSRIDRLARHLDRARRSALGRVGLEPWEFDVLTTLRREGAPYQLSPGALLRATLVSSGAMTNRIDRLVTRGLVARAPDPSDGRGVRVRLTEAGRDSADEALAELLAHERAVLTPLGTAEAVTLAALLRRLLLRFDAADGPATAAAPTTAGASDSPVD